MKAALIPLRLNELLGFAQRNPSASPELSRLFLSFDLTSAAWRFNQPLPQQSIHARGSRHSSSLSIQLFCCFIKAQDCCFNPLPTIQQKPNARINRARRTAD
jgi:hypothetical protein